MAISTKQRFWNKFEKHENGCWNWIAYKNTTGYGRFGFDGKVMGAHRFSWILKNGKIPNNMHVLHKCDNRRCVNPDHLFIGTQIDNNADMMAKGRHFGSGGQSKAILDEQNVVKIRQKYLSSSITQAELGAMFGVSKAQISKIINRQTWQHI